LQKTLRSTAKRAAHDDADAVLLIVEPVMPNEGTLLALRSLLRSGRASDHRAQQDRPVPPTPASTTTS